jgi:hypothetical protein
MVDANEFDGSPMGVGLEMPHSVRHLAEFALERRHGSISLSQRLISLSQRLIALS